MCVAERSYGSVLAPAPDGHSSESATAAGEEQATQAQQ